MGWFIGGGVLWFVLLVTLGILSIRKGHWVMFLIGIVFPLFWLIGALDASGRAPLSTRSSDWIPLRSRARTGAKRRGQPRLRTCFGRTRARSRRDPIRGAHR